MKTISMLVVLSTLLLSSCRGQKISLEKQDALKFEKAEYQRWTAGIKGGGAGYTINLTLDESLGDIVLDSVFFKKWIVKLDGGDSNRYYATIDDGSNSESDFPDATVAKKATPEVDIPFQLGEEEVVIAYKQRNELKYYKLSLSKAKQFNTPRY